ncbi:MAG TPA: hypothetical protein VF120_11430 [Ktedonobacterales bacterium]
MDDTDVQELPLLAGVAAFLRWLEELVVLISGPLLMAGLGIGLVALLSDGALLVNAPWLVYAWAISQTVGVDGQLVGAWYRVSVAVGRRRIGVASAYILLGLILAYVAYVAALVFATQQAYHLTTGQALARLGMDATSWLWQRSAVSVLLVCLSGYLRYRAPRKAVRSLDERKRAIQEQMELEALKQQQRAQRAQAAIGLVKGLGAAVRGSPPSLPDMSATAHLAADEESPQVETADATNDDDGGNKEASTLRPFVGARRASR